MRQSQLFTRTQKSAPKDEVALNAQLLTRGGFIYKNSAGIYSFLPLGWRVIKNIEAIVRHEMDAVGGQEMRMSALVAKKYWEKSGRWNVPIVFKTGLLDEKRKELSQGDSQFGLGWTHEEVLTSIALNYVESYKDLPFSAYQIQTKFRNEQRAKSGILRGREFIMKDMYSFHASEKDLFAYYDRVAAAYKRVFERCGLHAVYTLAAGGEFTMSNTHEFQVVSDVGEDTIYLCEKCDYAENAEISKLKDGAKCPKCGEKIHEKKAIEVGNIFPLGTKYSQAFGLQFTNEKGKKEDVVMGSYGIGVTRLMGTIVELSHDEHGILWPESIAPFKVHLLALNEADGTAVYDALRHEQVEVLYDDRLMSAGEKFAEADLIGIPWRFVVSPKLGEGMVEAKKRGEQDAKTMKLADAVKLVRK